MRKIRKILWKVIAQRLRNNNPNLTCVYTFFVCLAVKDIQVLLIVIIAFLSFGTTDNNVFLFNFENYDRGRLLIGQFQESVASYLWEL